MSDVCDSLRVKMSKHNEYLNERLHSLEDLLDCTNKQIEFTKKSKYEVKIIYIINLTTLIRNIKLI